MKKLLAVLTITVLLSGCDFSGKTKITFWHAMSNPKDKPLNALISDFEAKNPTIKVDAEYVGNYNILLQKLLASAGSGNPPDGIDRVGQIHNYPPADGSVERAGSGR